MMRLKPASLAILGTASIVVSVLASPAVARGAMAQILAKEQRHVQRHATHRSSNANAALGSEFIALPPLARTQLPPPARSIATPITSDCLPATKVVIKKRAVSPPSFIFFLTGLAFDDVDDFVGLRTYNDVSTMHQDKVITPPFRIDFDDPSR